jgi:hypothetical protein
VTFSPVRSAASNETVLGDALHTVLGELQRQAVSRHQGSVLFRQRGIGLCEDANEILRRERMQLHTDG